MKKFLLILVALLPFHSFSQTDLEIVKGINNFVKQNIDPFNKNSVIRVVPMEKLWNIKDSLNKKEVTFKHDRFIFNTLPNKDVKPISVYLKKYYGKEHIGKEPWEKKKKRYKSFIFVNYVIEKAYINFYKIEIIQGYNNYI